VKRKFTKIVEPKEQEIQVRDVDAGFTALVVTNGNSYRVTIPRNTVRMWNLKPGDQVQVRIVRVGTDERPKFQPVNC
jgi:hypothetical protein